MKKLIILALAFAFSMNLTAQTPQKIVSFVVEQHDCSWYATQAALWQKETKKNKKNASAWMYYYLATRYEHVMCGEPQYALDEEDYKVFKSILDEMAKYIPETYEYNYLMYYNEGINPANSKYLLKAYEIDSNRREIYPDLIVYYEINGKYAENEKVLKHQQVIAPSSPGLLAWNYNALMPLDSNAIVLTGGDNDTYPKWTLQAAYGVRKDVRVINTSLIMIEEYRNRVFQECGIKPFNIKQDTSNWRNFNALIVDHICRNSSRPVYICNSVPQDHYATLSDSLYQEGLVSKYSPVRYDNMAVMRRSYEQIMLLDYIRMPIGNDVSQKIVDYSGLNYIQAFLQLYDHYRLSGESGQAERLGDLLRLITKRAGNEEYKIYIDQYLRENH